MKSLVNFFKWIFIDSEVKYDKFIDNKILFASIILLAIGIVMVFSSSIAYANVEKGLNNRYFYLIRHMEYVIIGLILGLITFSLPTFFWQKHAKKIIIISALLLILVLIPHIGKTTNGSRRWINLFVFNIQPSELAKLAIAIYASAYVSGKEGLKSFFKDIVPIVVLVMFFVGLVVIEPDMGSATVIFIIALCVLFVAEIDKKYVIGITMIGVIGFVGLVALEPYRVRRVLGFINPWDDALGKGYQLTHSLLAFGHGGWLGVGLGNSLEKLFYLPEAHTDFILAVIAEETGVFGVMVILLLFWIIFYRGFTMVASEARKIPGRRFQAVLAQGISTWIFAQAIVNFGVAIGILPTKGLTLPFISYGGSSIVVSCIAIALLLKIDCENKWIRQGKSLT